MKELYVAIQTAKKAGAFLVDSLARTKTKTSKGKSDWVTSVDVEVEKLIKRELQNNFPEYGFNGEESNRIKGKSKLEWIVDPIDSTDNFIHQLPHFTTVIALMQDDKPILGVIYEPLADNIFYACKDKGAFLNNKRIHVSPIKNVSEALFFSVP
jgi:myo-inositol-1(or 4)-monophosphatase